MLLILFILILVLAGVTYVYHWHQNASDSMGGKIAPAKSYWLAFVLFHYFIYPLFFYYWIDNQSLEGLLLYIAVWFYLRMLVQGIMMFARRNWTPRIGIAHNLITAFLLMVCQIGVLVYYFDQASTAVVLVSGYILILIAITLTDTLYAHRFSKIVGDATRGKKAIWYASDAKEFETINKLTVRNNYIFTLVSVVLIIIMYYDKY